jgi:hypothetical protein
MAEVAAEAEEVEEVAVQQRAEAEEVAEVAEKQPGYQPTLLPRRPDCLLLSFAALPLIPDHTSHRDLQHRIR